MFNKFKLSNEEDIKSESDFEILEVKKTNEIEEMEETYNYFSDELFQPVKELSYPKQTDIVSEIMTHNYSEQPNNIIEQTQTDNVIEQTQTDIVIEQKQTEIGIENKNKTIYKNIKLNIPSIDNNEQVCIDIPTLTDDIEEIVLNFPYLSNKYNGLYKIKYNYYMSEPLYYTGLISKGKRNGYGKLEYSDNEYKEGYFVNNEFISGVHSKNNVKRIGIFNSDGILNDDNATLYLFGYLLKGKIINNKPIINHCKCLCDKLIRINFLGNIGTLRHSEIYYHNENYIEGCMDVVFEDETSFNIKTIKMYVCLYSNNDNEYESIFPTKVKIGKITLKNDKIINNKTIFMDVNINNDVLFFTEDFNMLKNLFNCNDVIKIDKQEYSFLNNRIINIDINKIEEWNNDRLIEFILIMFPHINYIFIENIKKYNISGKEFKNLTDFHLKYLLNVNNRIHNELIINVNILQIRDVLNNKQCPIPLIFYLNILKMFPSMNKNILNFIYSHQINTHHFKYIDSNLINNIFNPIHIYKIIFNLCQ